MLTNHRLSILLAFFITYSITNAQANEGDELSFFNADIPIVLSATRLAQPQTEAPASITVIDRALIKASGATQVAELFRLVPGMQVGNARGNFPVVAYQGLTSEFPQGIQVVIDGSSVYSPIFGGVIWSTLPIAIEDIERIEIVRGPNNASFGANAFQGVINITTLHASQAPALTTNFRINNNQSERAFFRLVSSDNNGRLNYRVSIASEKNEGYKQFADNFSKNELSSRVDFRLNTRNTLQLNFSALDSKRQTQSPVSALLAFDPKRDRNESSQFAQINWEHHTTDAQQINTHISFHHFDGKDKYAALAGDFDITTESTTWNIDVENILSLSDSQRLAWGVGATHESVYAPFRVNSNNTISNTRLRLFGNLESKLSDKVYLNTGGLIEHEQLSGTNLSPRITINYLPKPNHAYRLTATKAFRTPVITEEKREVSLFPPAIIQESAGNLEPETVTSIEAGYHGIYWQNTLNTDLKLFKSRFKHLIDNSLSATPAILDNQDSTSIYGAELEVNYRPNRNNIFHAGYAYTRVNQVSNAQLKKSIPKHNFNLLFSHQYGNSWHSGIEYYYTSKMQYLGVQNDPQGTFQRVDLSLGKLFKLTDKQSLDITLDTQLALNKNIDFHQQASADNLFYLKVDYRIK